jgi:FkbM family methyltransferase
MKPAAIKRQFLNEFAKDVELTSFQKDRLTFEIMAIRADYELGSRFTEYIKEHRMEIEAFINGLDPESKKEMTTILSNLEYMSIHTLIDTIKKFFLRGPHLLEHLNAMEAIKNNYKLPLDMYEESIFKYKHGLKFVPSDVVHSLKHTDILDCGAYIGESALVFEREYDPRAIYSFEPVPDNYDLLLETIKLNDLKKMIPVAKGVGECTAMVKYHPLGVSSFISEDGKSEMEVISIDEFVREKQLTIGLIKMDIEGHELPALTGAKETIKRFKPILLIAIYHNPKELFEITRHMDEILPGYEFRIKLLADIRPLAEIHLIAW